MPETLTERRQRLADTYRESLYRLAAAVDAVELGVMPAADLEYLVDQQQRRGAAWLESRAPEARVAVRGRR